MNINLIKFEILEELYKHKKVTAVAEALKLKQPTITFHLKAMEKDFGVKLFEAKSGKLILTEAGEALYHYASKINALTKESFRVVKESESIKIGASYIPATYLLPHVLFNYTEKNPKLSISLKVNTSPLVLNMLQKHEIDIGVISCEPFELPNIISYPLLEEEMVIFFSTKHPLASEEYISPKLIEKNSFILHGEKSSTRSITLKWFENSGIKVNSKIELNSLESIKRIVLQGRHISLISKLAIQQEINDGNLTYREIPSLGNLLTKRNIYYVINKDRLNSSILTNFIESLTHSS
ncbi:LysR family transcriptional regulator [Clostridium sp.]|uniref:LysR family transcriptional regulator n=1 Tax=Clostridium sp. TaxID=1506 RepID=UPI00260CC27D|nr:LysR family transcriptional regulator [Clostridium sp.]